MWLFQQIISLASSPLGSRGQSLGIPLLKRSRVLRAGNGITWRDPLLCPVCGSDPVSRATGKTCFFLS